MNKNRMMIGAAVAIVVGLVAGRYVFQQFKLASSSVKPVQVGPVVVAAGPLQLGTRLQPLQLRLVDWPSGSQPAGSFARVEDLADRALITPVVENEAILEQKLAPKEAGAGLPATIPEGMRAVSIRMDDVIGVAGFVMPGTKVDVLVTGDPGSGGRSGEAVTRTFLEDVRVLAAGQRVQQDKDGKPQTESVVTLLVTPGEADLLTLASTEGKIHLALRNTIDTTETNPPPVRRASLFVGSVPAPPPTKKVAAAPPRPAVPPPPYVVEVIRGDKRETHSFPEKKAESEKPE